MHLMLRLCDSSVLAAAPNKKAARV